MATDIDSPDAVSFGVGVAVVQIGDVGMCVLQGLVSVAMGVPDRLIAVVAVAVVAVVVDMLVVVFDRVVAVLLTAFASGTRCSSSFGPGRPSGNSATYAPAVPRLT